MGLNRQDESLVVAGRVYKLSPPVLNTVLSRLHRVLVRLGRHDEALVVAERAYRLSRLNI